MGAGSGRRERGRSAVGAVLAVIGLSSVIRSGLAVCVALSWFLNARDPQEIPKFGGLGVEFYNKGTPRDPKVWRCPEARTLALRRAADETVVATTITTSGTADGTVPEKAAAHRLSDAGAEVRFVRGRDADDRVRTA